MKLTRIFTGTLVLSLLFAAALAQAATVTGTVTDKTTGKPAAGDAVALLEPMSGMSEVGRATTDAHGRYTLNLPGNNPYLIRVTHEGADYFITAPEGGGTGDVSVYDVAAKVSGVRIEADVIQLEADNGQLKVDERYFVHNNSSPPITQWSQRSFEIVLPADAVITDSGAQRPNGLPTSVKLDPDGPKGHYSFNFPIQPDQGDKDTLFQVGYTLPYIASTFTFHSQVTLPAENFGVLLPKSMTFTPGAGMSFTPIQEDPGVQTFLVKDTLPGQVIAFTVSGAGTIPREQQGDNGGQEAGAPGNQPGGGLGTPIGTPGPLDQHRFLGLSLFWWLLILMTVLFMFFAIFFLRKPATAGVAVQAGMALPSGVTASGPPPVHSMPVAPAAKNTALLNALKEELFALESEKISGTLAPDEYAEQKAALETVLKRALKRS